MIKAKKKDRKKKEQVRDGAEKGTFRLRSDGGTKSRCREGNYAPVFKKEENPKKGQQSRRSDAVGPNPPQLPCVFQ